MRRICKIKLRQIIKLLSLFVIGTAASIESFHSSEDYRRWYWSFDDTSPGPNAPMSTNVLSVGSQSTDIQSGQKRNSYQVTSVTLEYEISLPTSCLFLYNCADGYTVSFWIKVLGPTSGQQLLITSGGDLTDHAGFVVFYDGDNQQIEVSATDCSLSYQMMNSSVANDTWTHIAFVIDPVMPGTQLWISGNYIGHRNDTVARTGSCTNTQNAIYIGKSNTGGYANGNFLIDELHLWEVDASFGQIKKLFEQSGESAISEFWIDFDRIYENNLLSGEFMPTAETGTIKQVRGRYGKGLEMGMNASINLGQYCDCIEFTYPTGSPTGSSWCENGFTLSIWIQLPNIVPAGYSSPRIILGSLDVIADTNTSGFALLDIRDGDSCKVQFIQRNYDFYQYQDFSCSFDTWMFLNIGYHQALGGYYRRLYETWFKHGAFSNLFEMKRVMVSIPHIFQQSSSLYLGHPTHGAFFHVDDLYLSGKIQITSKMYIADPNIHRLEFRGTSGNDNNWRPNLSRGATNKFSPIMNVNSLDAKEEVVLNSMKYSEDSFYFNGKNAYGRLTPHHMSLGHEDVEHRFGFSFHFWIYQCGTRDTVTTAYYVDSGGVEDTDWGYTVYYNGGFLNVVVSTSRYEWRQLLPFGFKQWIHFAMSWYPDTGFEVYLNHISQGFFSKRTRRKTPQNRVSDKQDFYYGRPSTYYGNLENVLEPMYLARIFFWDRVMQDPSQIHTSGHFKYNEYSHFIIEGPFIEYSRHIWNASNDMDIAFPASNWLNGTFLFEMLNGAQQVYRNEFFNMSVALNGINQVIRSDTLVTQCISNPDGCYGRSYQLSFWVKPLDLASTPPGVRRSYMWIGSENVTVLSFYHEDGNDTIELYAKGQKCVQSIYLSDNEWTWVTLNWEFKDYGSSIVRFAVYNNTVNATDLPVCSSSSRNQTTTFGRIVIGGEADVGHDGPYINFNKMEFDDFMLKDTYVKVHSKWNEVKSTGFKSNYNWFGEARYLYNVTPPDLYIASDCVQYADKGRFPSAKLRISPIGEEYIFHVKCSLLPEIEVTETEVFLNVTGLSRNLNQSGRFPSFIGRYSMTPAALTNLRANSISCRQRLGMTCNTDTLFKTPTSSYWRDKSNLPRYYWGGADDDHLGKCDCGVKGQCTNLTAGCNCDGHAGWDEDVGYLKEKDRLPINGLYIEYTPIYTAKGVWSVGSFICQNIDPNGMHYILDTFTISEHYPGRAGTFHGTQDSAMLSPGIHQGSKSIQLDGSTNYISLPNFLENCFYDITDCPKGFSASLWVRLPDLTNDAVFISNIKSTNSKGTGFSIGLKSGDIVCDVRYLSTWTTITAPCTAGVWTQIGITWKADKGTVLYINGHNVKTMGATETTTANSATNPGSRLVIGNDASSLTSFARISVDEVWFSPFFFYTQDMMTTRATVHAREYFTTFDTATYPNDLLSTTEVFLDNSTTIPIEIPGMVNGAFRLYHPNLDIARLYKKFYYECLGNLDLCYDGLSFGLWARLHPDMWTETTNFHTLFSVTGLAASSPGFHMYFKGRDATLEIRDIAAGKELLSQFDIPIEKWFHFMFTWRTGSNPSIYINSFTVPVTHTQNVKSFTVASPPDTVLYLAYSTQFASYKTLADVDDAFYNASAGNVTVVKQMYAKATKTIRFPFDNATTMGDVQTTMTGSPIIIHGRFSPAIYLRGVASLKSVIPFYLECFSNPSRCNSAFTLSFWLFLKSTYSSGTLISAVNAAMTHGFKLLYTYKGNGTLSLNFTVLSATKSNTASVELPERTWSHLAFRWAVNGSSMVWVNGTETGNWTEEANAIGTEGDVYLVFGSDSSFSESADMAIDEFYFREKFEKTSDILSEYDIGKSSNDDMHWTLDSYLAGGTLNGQNMSIASQSAQYISAPSNNGTLLNGVSNYLNLGYFPGTCLTHLEFCQTLNVQFKFMFEGVDNGDQYIISRTTAASPLSGFYFRYANLNPLLPCSRYYEVGVQFDNKIWNVTFNMKPYDWINFHMKWKPEVGLEVWIDGLLVGSNTDSEPVPGISSLTDTTNFVIGKANDGSGHFAQMRMDDINVWDGEDGPPGVNMTDDQFYQGCYLAPANPTKTQTVVIGISPLVCRSFCGHTYRHTGISEGVRCACIDNIEVYTKVSDAFCSVLCPGSNYSCGNNAVMLQFSVYRTTSHLPFPIIAPISNCTTNVTGPYDDYNLSYDLVDVNANFTLSIHCEGGNNICHNFSMGDGNRFIQNQASLQHLYTGIGIYAGELILRNELNEVVLPFKITSTFPLLPIENMEVTTPSAVVNTEANINISLSQGNDISCTLYHGDGTSRAYYKKDYQPSHILTKTYTATGDYSIIMNCSNPLSSANVSTTISIQRPISSTSLNYNRGSFWVFKLDTNKTLSWSTIGSHLNTTLVLDGQPVEVKFDSQSVVFNESEFNTIGSHLGWIIIQNDISSSANISFEMRVERPITEARIVLYPFAPAGSSYTTCVLIPSGSNAAVEFTFTPPTVLQKTLLGNIENGTVCFSGVFNTVGEFTVNCSVYNNLTVSPGIRNSSFVVVENEVKEVEITVFNSSTLQFPISVNASHMVGAADPTNAMVIVSATKQGENISVPCYSSLHGGFRDIEAECVIASSGWYNMTVEVFNNVSHQVAWKVVELGDKLSGLEFKIAKSIVAVGSIATVLVKIPNGIGTGAYVDFKDGYISPGTPLVIKSFTPVNHIYSQHGNYNISVFVTNQISSRSDECQEPCIIAQENITGLTFTQPLAFEFALPIKVNWTKKTGSHLNYSASIDGRSISTFTETENGGFMEVSTLAWLGLGFHTVNVEAANDVSGPEAASAQIVIVKRIKGFRTSLSTYAEKTHTSLQLNYHIDDGTKSTVNFTSQSDILGSKYYESISNLDDTVDISFTTPDVYLIYGKAYNPLHEVSNSPLTLVIQNPVVNGLVDITTVDTYISPVQIMIDVNPGLDIPTNFSISINFGDGATAVRSEIIEHNETGFAVEHLYPRDGLYDVIINVSNLVSQWTYTERIMVGIAVSNVSLTASKFNLRVNESFIINATVREGSNIEISYDFGIDNVTELANVSANELHQTTFLYPRPGAYRLYVVARNTFSQVMRILSNIIYVQIPVSDTTLFSANDAYAVDSAVNLTWWYASGTNISCELYYAEQLIFAAQRCKMNNTLEIAGSKSPSVAINDIKVVSWNLVTPKREVLRPIHIERPIKGLDLLLHQAVWPIRNGFSLITTIEAGSKINLTMNFSNNITKKVYQIRQSEFNHRWEVNTSFEYPGIIEVAVYAENPLGSHNVTKTIEAQTPIYNGRAEISEPDNYKTPAQFRIVLNENDFEPTNLSINCHLGDGTFISMSSFIHAYSNVWVLNYNYNGDGMYNVSIDVENAVSNWSHFETITVGEQLANLSISVSEYTVSTARDLVVTVDVLRGSNALLEYDFGELGSLTQSNITKGEIRMTKYMYTTPGIYWLTVRAWNVFNELFKTHHSMILAFDMVRGIEVSTDRTAYAIGDPITISWEVPMGTNISCEVTLDSQQIYRNVNCNNTGRVICEERFLPINIGNYTATLGFWNQVTRLQQRSVNVRLERSIKEVDIYLSHPFRAQGESSSFEITVLGGSNFGLEVYYSDLLSPVKYWYAGSWNNSSESVYRTYPVIGDIVITAVATNVLSSIVRKATVEVQAPVVGLFVEPTNSSQVYIPVNLTISQIPNLLHPTHVIFAILWGDRSETIHHDLDINLNNTFPDISHLYAYEGRYTVTLTAFNNLSTQAMETTVQVGEKIQGLNVTTQSSIGRPDERLSFCVTITHGSNASVTVEFSPLDRLQIEGILYPLITKCFTYSYDSQGLYDSNFTVQNSYGEMTTQVMMTIEEPISGLKIIKPRGLIANDTSEVLIRFYNLGMIYCVLLDLGDGGEKYVYGIADCALKHQGHLYIAPMPEETYVTIKYKFVHTGTYMANLTAYNRVSREELLEPIVVIFCDKPTATLYGGGKTPYLPANIYRSLPIKLDAGVINPCSIPWNVSMNWTVEVWPKKGEHYFYEFEQPDAPLLEIPARALPYGDIKVTFFVKVGPYDGIEDVDYKYLKIVKTPLVASLKGGKAFALKKTDNMIIDARPFCYDPDNPEDLSSLRFAFKIRNNGAKHWITLKADSAEYVARRKRSLSNLDGGVLYLSQSMDVGLFELMVLVTKDSRQMVFSQLIQIVEGVTLDVDIICHLNCRQKVTTSRQVTLNGSCIDCADKGIKGRLSYEWELFLLEEDMRQAVPLDSITTTGSKSDALGIIAKVLKPGNEYTVRLTISQGAAKGFSEYPIRTNLPPYGGHCDASPEKGVATFSKYIISCKQWKDEGLNVKRDFNADKLKQEELYFSYFAKPKGDIDAPFTMLYFGPSPNTPSLDLPMGYQNEDYIVDILVTIQDSFGEATDYMLSARVGEFYLKYEEVLSQLNGDVTAFDFHFASQDIRAISNSVASLTEQLDRRNKAENCRGSSGSTITKEDQDKRKKARSDLIATLNRASDWVISRDNIQQTAKLLKSITTTKDELTQGTMVQAASLLEELALKMKNLTESNPEEIIETSGEIFQCLSNIIEASSPSSVLLVYKMDFDGPPEEVEAKRESAKLEARRRLDAERACAKNVVGKGLLTIDSIQRAVLEGKLPGEKRIDISTTSLQITLQRLQVSSLSDLTMTLHKSKFKFPNSDIFGGETVGVVDTQIVASKENLFAWDDSAIHIKTPSIGLKLSNKDGTELKVKDLKDTIEVTLPLTKPSSSESTVISLQNVEKRDNDLVLHNITYTPPSKAIQFRIVPAQEKQIFELYIKYNSHASISDFDSKVVLTSANKYSHQWITVTQNGTYYVAVRQATRKRYSSIEYTAHVDLFGCMYWDANSEVWSDYGCQAKEVTDNSIIGACNHLTFFGGNFIVAPNSIDFNTVFNKFANIGDNLAVLLTVAALLVLFWLGVLLLRRIDIRDLQKWKVRSLLDNAPSDTYQYVLTVTTGSKMGSGTTSKVQFIIVGDDGDSDVRILDDGYRKGFPKGSTYHYLVTTPVDLGDLRFVRIWHDGSGRGGNASWYLQEIVVQDISRKERFHFICDAWLATDRGDGSVDRLIPQSSPDELKQFGRLFGQASRKGMSDEHMWFSVFSRPHRSSFTRVQRWGCCISLLFTSMIASAMWFGTIDENDTGQAIKIGPFAWSTKQFFIATMTAILVFPINFIIIIIFKKSKPPLQIDQEIIITAPRPGTPAERKRREALCKRTAVENSLCLSPQYGLTARDINLGILKDELEANYQEALFNIKGEMEEKENKKVIKSVTETPWYRKDHFLPHWCIYFGWFFVFISVILPAFFCILYSVEWGKEKSEMWLSAMFIGFAESVLVIQPIKVVVVAILMALIFKDPVLDAIALEHGETNNDVDMSHVAARVRRSKMKLSPIDETKMKEMRTKRKKEMKMEGNLQRILVYTFYLIVITIISYAQRDPMAYYVTKHVEDALLQHPKGIHDSYVVMAFENVLTIEDFENWANEKLIKELMPTEKYNGDPIIDWRNLRYQAFDGNYVRVGGTRMRQLRAKQESCMSYKTLNEMFDEVCAGEYSKNKEETMDYNIEWKGVNGTMATSPWVYEQADALGTLPLWGNLAVYSGGGYVMNHHPTYQNALAQQKEAFAHKWLDKYTRAVVTEFVLYNPNANFFAIVSILLEMTATGSINKWWDINVMNLYSYSGNFAIFRICAELIFCAFFAFNVYQFIRSVMKKKKAHFQDLWSFVDLGLLIGSLVTAILYLVRYFLVRNIMNKFSENKDDVLGFSRLGFYDRAVTCCTGILVFFSSARMLCLLTFNQRVEMLCRVLLLSAKSLVHYTFAFIIVMMAFTSFAFKVFGTSILSYATFISAFESLLAAFVGARMFNNMETEDSKFGRAFFLFFVFVMLFLMTNMLISILTDAMAEVKKEMKDKINSHEFIDYFGGRIKDLIGFDILFDRKKQEPKSSMTTIGLQCDLEEEEIKSYMKRDQHSGILLKHLDGERTKDSFKAIYLDYDDDLKNAITNYGYCKQTLQSKKYIP